MEKDIKDIHNGHIFMKILLLILGIAWIVFSGYIFYYANCKTVVKFYTVTQTPARCLILK